MDVVSAHESARKQSQNKTTFIAIGVIVIIVSLFIGGIIGYFIGVDNSSNGNNSSNCGSTTSGSNDNSSNSSSSSDSCDFYYAEYDYEYDAVDPALYGQWETVVPTDESPSFGPILGIQMIHTTLLPSGKILMVSGSSNRASDITYNGSYYQSYPDYEIPHKVPGLYDWRDRELLNIANKTRYYNSVNNNGILDIDYNYTSKDRFNKSYIYKFNRIPHPLQRNDTNNIGYFLSNDLFCTGQNHLRDGNVFYSGGTEFYLRFFSGPKTMYIFNWTKEEITDWDTFDWTIAPENEDSYYYPWLYAGEMNRGRWYPRTVPLLDGRMVIFSGTVDWESMNYNNQQNPNIGFFDYDTFLKNNKIPGNGEYVYIDSSNQTNSPFMTRLTEQFNDTQLEKICSENIDAGNSNQNFNICKAELQNDSFPEYPQNYLMPDGKNVFILFHFCFCFVFVFFCRCILSLIASNAVSFVVFVLFHLHKQTG